ncbi:transposase [Escherichia coli]|nr:transposase [Escherichia coli]
MTKNTRFSPEVRQRAVRMVLESQGEYHSQWAAICSIAPKIGCTPETLRVWVRQHERDTGGGDGGLTTAEPRQPGGCKLKTAPVRPVVAARPAEYVCSEDLFY